MFFNILQSVCLYFFLHVIPDIATVLQKLDSINYDNTWLFISDKTQRLPPINYIKLNLIFMFDKYNNYE